MITAFLPCRSDDRRILRKNVKPFGSRTDGLIGLKLEQLLHCSEIDRIVVSTNDPIVQAIAEQRCPAGGKVSIIERPHDLSYDETTVRDLAIHALNNIGDGVVVWTHVTSPFFGADKYSLAVNSYKKCLGAGYDSLMSVRPIQTYLWNDEGPINYDPKLEKWPWTGSLKQVYSVDSSVFIVARELMASRLDRIGARPYFFATDPRSRIDIDTEEDFAGAAEIHDLLTKSGGRYGSFGSE